MEDDIPKLAADSDELDHVPLIRRRNLLLATKQKPTSFIDIALKQEDAVSESRRLQDVFSFPCAAREVGVQLLKREEHRDFATPRGATPELPCSKTEVDSSVDQSLHNDAFSRCVEMTAICDSNGTKLNAFASSDQIDCAKPSIGVAQLKRIDVDSCTLPENPTLSEVSAEVKVAYPDNMSSSFGDGMNGFAGSRVQTVMVKNEISMHSTYDHLDHIALKERQRMLLSRKLFRLENSVSEHCNTQDIPEAFSEDVLQQLDSQEKGGTSIVGEEAVKATFQPYDNPGTNASVLCRSTISSPQQNVAFSSSTSTTSQFSFDVAKSKSNDYRKSSESDKICSSERIPPTAMNLSLCGGQDDGPTRTSRVHSSVKIKDEPLDNSDFLSLGRCVRGDFSLNILPIKQELRSTNKIGDDEIDNMLLRDRMNLLVSQENSEVTISKNYGCLVKIVPSVVSCSPISESAKPISISRPRKRKKTATDSIKTALEEDAPGLLQVLIDKGVLVDEIKLYGEIKSDEALDESFCEDSFAQLEAVISKLFSQRQSFFKFAPIRCTKESRASYCLACLISLVEQARYLQFRNWPVEWGWCRDLQSFIFVFARHNRIVLERPEYGYATYFFELVDSLPIEWQIKRLVTAMKLTSCSRLSLIENKALTVGEDLSEGEAQVLLEYGWEPNTGLGTMLKYCERVVHDRKNESDSSEWRSKIGKMLMDGYNGGTLVTTNIPKKVIECREVQCPEIKLEF
ncbi:uncharacterized protein LOC112188264 isoform X1 [Rosa chinensis]|uniref:uncharacterized protein LOC112188264 isoform X1 n=1 Tax=Rosa chinensis TaxID=74649 RepID=UPI000D0890DB|nr:uncharacterized protein LOC112188264 isoform X1 [Rosa chinensis]